MDNSFASKLREINAHELAPRPYTISARELVEKACIAESESRLGAAFYGKPLIANIIKAQEQAIKYGSNYKMKEKAYDLDKAEPIPYLEKSYALPFKISKEMLEDDVMYPGKIIYEPEPELVMNTGMEEDNGCCSERPFCIDASTKLVIDAMITRNEDRELIFALVAKFRSREYDGGPLANFYLIYCSTRDAINKYLDSIGY